MSNSAYVRPLEPKYCAWCGGVVSGRRAATLVARADGYLVGPYHYGCAELCRLAYQRGDLEGEPPGDYYGRLSLGAREENLPW